MDGRFAETSSQSMTGVGLLACTLPAKPSPTAPATTAPPTSAPPLAPVSRVAPANVAPEPTGPADPTASGTPEPTAPVTPPPPANYSGTAQCGELALPVTVNGATGAVTVNKTDEEIRAMFRPRLAG